MPAERAPHHVLDRDAGERLAFVEGRGEQHGKGGFVELNPFPKWSAAEPLVLMPVAVLDLGGAHVAQSVARFLLGAERQQRAGGLDQIPRPDEM